jgi:hypothetical protein
MKFSTSVELYAWLKDDFVTIDYVSRKIKQSYQATWKHIQILRYLKMLDSKKSPMNLQITLYRLKKMSFEDFLKKVNQ